MKIRLMKPEDLPGIIAIFINENIIDTSNLQQILKSTLEKFGNLCLILENEHQEIIGGIFGKIENNTGIINYLALPAEEHGKGYGAKLIQKVTEELRSSNVKIITLKGTIKMIK